MGARLMPSGTRKWLVGAVALALLLGAFWHFTSRNVSTGGQRDAAPVRVASVEHHDMPVVEHTLGTIVAISTVQVSARVQGTLEESYFQEGQFVKKGDLLFLIDPRPFHAALAQAQGVLRRDEALLKNANRDKLRYDKLFATNAISSQQHDTADTNADALAATVAVDKAALDMAQLNLGYTQIRSPLDGKTGPLLVQPGNMVSASANTALVTIEQLQPFKLSFNLPQSDLPRIQERLRSHSLVVTIDRQGLRSLSAPVDFISNAISNQSGTIELRASFDNADLSFLPGQTVNVTVQFSNIPHALTVAHDALNDGPNGTYVYVVVNGRAKPCSVRILFDDSKHAAVEGDVRLGDEVIVEGQLRVVPGGEVTVFPAARASSPEDRNRVIGAAGGLQ